MTEGAVLLGLIVAVGYLVGSIPFGLLLTRAAGLGDIRKMGSGNIGATNVLRTGKRGLAAATLLLDGAKGAAGALIGFAAAGDLGAFWGGLAAVVGHLFPVWLGFRGGKGVATGFGVLIAASPAVCLGAGALWLLIAKFGRRSSVASLSAFLAAPIIAASLHAPWEILALSICITGLVFIRHEANIRRLFAGTEPRIGENT